MDDYKSKNAWSTGNSLWNNPIKIRNGFRQKKSSKHKNQKRK